MPWGTVFEGGFDYFLVSAAMTTLFPAPSPFCLGAPWWDYWVPMITLLEGRKCVRGTEPLFTHVTHDVQWDSNAHALMGLHVAEHLPGRGAHGSPASAAALPGASQIFMEFFFRRMRALSKVVSGEHKASRELASVLEAELLRSFAHSVLKYIYARSETLP